MDNFERISIYVPQKVQPQKPLERLNTLAQDRDRSLNYMVVAAVLDFVARAEKAERDVTRRKKKRVTKTPAATEPNEEGAQQLTSPPGINPE